MCRPFGFPDQNDPDGICGILLEIGLGYVYCRKRYLDKWKVGQSIVSIENKLAQAPGAAVLADFIRTRLLARGDTFTFETVMSHPSKIDFMKSAEGLRI